MHRRAATCLSRFLPSLAGISLELALTNLTQTREGCNSKRAFSLPVRRLLMMHCGTIPYWCCRAHPEVSTQLVARHLRFGELGSRACGLALLRCRLRCSHSGKNGCRGAGSVHQDFTNVDASALRWLCYEWLRGGPHGGDAVLNRGDCMQARASKLDTPAAMRADPVHSSGPEDPTPETPRNVSFMWEQLGHFSKSSQSFHCAFSGELPSFLIPRTGWPFRTEV